MDPVPAGKLSALARYGPVSKAPTLPDLESDRQAATLATVRRLETSSVADGLVVPDVLITSNLLARAERGGLGSGLGWSSADGGQLSAQKEAKTFVTLFPGGRNCMGPRTPAPRRSR
ncbi:hypothetical protein [Nonomuraea sp. NPDC049758]|uniref:hypothetical protein n=1 Tax=Nonomuraea sp. NPDC049758 TaxID=3154360 RepID=UPI003435BDAE